MIANELLSEELDFAYTDGELLKLMEWENIPFATLDELREIFEP